MKPLQVFLPESFIKQLKIKAIGEGLTMSELVRRELGTLVEFVQTEPVPVVTPPRKSQDRKAKKLNSEEEKLAMK